MSNKKSLLTESEIRRFMTLANIPVINNINEEKSESQRYAEGEAGLTMRGSSLKSEGEELDEMGGVYEEDPAPEEMEAGEGEDTGEEMPDEEMPDEVGGDKEAQFEEIVMKLAELVGVDVEVDAGEEGGVEDGEEGGEEMAPPEGDTEVPPEGEEEMQELEERKKKAKKSGEEEEEEEEEEESEGQLKESKLVDTVLARVTARLVAEAKKKKADKKKKMSAAEKMKAMKAAKDKKKKLEEANAAAPKSSTSNSSKAGKGHGPGKTEFGVHKGDATKSHEFKEGEKNNSGKHEYKPLAASGEHTVSHGKTSKVTGQGGNKKK